MPPRVSKIHYLLDRSYAELVQQLTLSATVLRLLPLQSPIILVA